MPVSFNNRRKSASPVTYQACRTSGRLRSLRLKESSAAESSRCSDTSTWTVSGSPSMAGCTIETSAAITPSRRRRRRRFSTALSDRPTCSAKRCAGIWLFFCSRSNKARSKRSRRAVSGFMRPILAENRRPSIKLCRLPTTDPVKVSDMNVSSRLAQPSGDQPVEPVRLLAAFAETPLLDLPRLAARLGVAKVLAKDESRRMLGNFKSLGGTYAALRALARAMGTGKIERPDPTCAPGVLPTLICASDGNHGLAVAAAARLAGTASHVFLRSGVSAGRARRIVAQGAAITWVQGCYDDAVETAAVAARAGAGILVADTAADVTDPVIEDVMTGYSVIAMEIRRQVKTAGHRRPTHIFVQAGVGGLAATMITLKPWMAGPAEFIVAEPERAAC